ncbi:methionine synthase-like protein [Lasiosphaeria ovina]|uniref:Methionine synthase-like protein n=1 Tax=Lasiosphaeria ovina TaxID=92902 RepID=A0AAE0KHK8_9PEZI|nr:methionine synthase-like protein [Lasiosphaeria ovina]
MPLPAGVYRADHVGSFLRPKALLAARETLNNTAQPTNSGELRRLEDEHIAEVVRRQVDSGLRSVTDGEFRRAWFHIDFLQHLAGVERQGNLASVNNNNNNNNAAGATSHGMTPPRLAVVGKISHPKPIQVDDFAFLARQVAAVTEDKTVSAPLPITAKVCIPSPTMVHFRGGRDAISSSAYPSLEDDGFFADLAAAYRAELADLYAAGCRFVQLDDTNLAYLCDAQMAAAAAARHGGASALQLARTYAALINACVAGRPADLVIGIHLCRGNYRSQWFAAGGYEPVAAVLFGELDVDVYFLEFDDERSGGFAPLRSLPAAKTAVLGLMSSKTPTLDDKGIVVARLKEAARFCPRGLDQLCLSHQCGFSSTEEGNELSEAEQWAKVRLEVEIAKEVWGPDLAV